MHRRKTHAVCGVLAVVAATLSVLWSAQAADYSPDAGGDMPAKGMLWKSDINYDVYYEVNAYETDRVENVRIVDTITVGGRVFLIIRYSEASSKEGYIVLDSVRAVLPTAASKPYRSSDTRRQY